MGFFTQAVTELSQEKTQHEDFVGDCSICRCACRGGGCCCRSRCTCGLYTPLLPSYGCPCLCPPPCCLPPRPRLHPPCCPLSMLPLMSARTKVDTLSPVPMELLPDLLTMLW